ncbi:primary-amine oxidase [Paenarthrobacter aurescens]|uniref:primary-amine oxidase n=1 Tax=Paenarthrobacter aurescens TaxID=43663 RepID=UPI0021C22AFA|nr:primary-amine oxidase [Paenarthrobacter aurescens]MCT9870414.1 primary-amine oxidase [Paenarthrobacter aurescens]
MSKQLEEAQGLSLEEQATGLSIGDTRRSPERAVTRARKVQTLRERYAARAEELAEFAHPLDPLSPDEYERVASTVRHDARFDYHMRFASIELTEPTKQQLASGADIERQAEVLLLDGRRRVTHLVSVDVRKKSVLSWTDMPGQQPAITIDEFVDIEIETKSDPRVQEALRKRGLDLQQRAMVMVDPWSAGNFGVEEEQGRRIARGVFYMRSQNDDNQYAHPVDGLVALIDLDTLELVGLEDEHVYPVPMEDANYGAKFIDTMREDIKPLDIVQPQGPSFTVEGWKVNWQKWSFRVGFSQREGLVLHDIRYNDNGNDRSIMYRASIAEMTVPYGDTSLTQRRKNAFDVGEYGLGMCANALELGCDCLGEIYYFDSTVISAQGDLDPRNNVICLHEEDAGILWKHYDQRTDKTEVRRSRRLVISSISTIGNYEYGFYWYFYQDGTMELEVKATGIVQTGALHDGETNRHGTKLGANLYAPHHQHFFCVRLDPMVDGIQNRVTEVNTQADPIGPSNPYGNAFYPVKTTFNTELEAIRDLNLETSRSWVIESSTTKNALGGTPGYRLVPGENCKPYAQPGSSIAARAEYMYHHLWVTPWNKDEKYPAGMFPNQDPGADGLQVWTAEDRNIRDEDVVLWYTLGHHHLVRPEDWPVMPVARMGFALKPSGFFTQSPAIDVPPSEAVGHCEGHC